MLRRFWDSLGLSGLCHPTLGLSPKETKGTRARKGARGASGEPLEISISASPRCLPACPRVDARIAKGSLQTLPHIVAAAPLRAQVSRAPPDWKAAPRLGSLGEPGARTRGGGARAARGRRRRGPIGTPGGAAARDMGTRRTDPASPARAPPAPGSLERSGCARSGLGREVPRQRKCRAASVAAASSASLAGPRPP